MENIAYMFFEADQKEIVWWAMCFRGVLVFFITIILIKIGGKRIFGKQAAFDIVVSIMLGAIMAKGITGSAKFIPTIITTTVIVILHRVLSWLTFDNHRLGNFVKGEITLLVKEGEIKYDAMKKNSISEEDLYEALRSEGRTTDMSRVKEAYLERSGRISIILKDQ